jgi:2-polyprenyl-3-methyl-5-hydroxy-6-metoxy-1,4-benzoquinol methylase
LQAAQELGWDVCGLDVSQSAVDYVSGTLGFPAFCASLEDFAATATFDAITLWFVIEHFENAGAMLKKIHSLLKTGGVFAFSTPSASGVSARTNPKAFYEMSPHDHYTLWEPQNVSAVLARFGFKTVKIILLLPPSVMFHRICLR